MLGSSATSRLALISCTTVVLMCPSLWKPAPRDDTLDERRVQHATREAPREIDGMGGKLHRRTLVEEERAEDVLHNWEGSSKGGW